MTIRNGRLAAICLAAAIGLGASAANAATKTVTCPVDEVAVFSNRVHVHCNFPKPDTSGLGGQIAKALQDGAARYYALPTSDPMADHLVTLGAMALEHKGSLDLGFNDDAAANPAGCLAADCRRIVSILKH